MLVPRVPLQIQWYMWTYLVGKSGNGGEGTLAMSPPPKGPHWTPTLFPGNATLPHVMSHFVTPWDDVTPHRDDTWSHMPHVTAWNSGQRGRQLSRCTWHMTPNPEGSQVGWFHTLTWADTLLHTSRSTGMTPLVTPASRGSLGLRTKGMSALTLHVAHDSQP